MITNVARRAEGVLTAAGFVELMSLAVDDARPPDLLVKIISARRIGTHNRAWNSILLLQEMGALEQVPGGLKLAAHTTGDANLHTILRQLTVAHYCKLLPGAPLGQVFQRDPETGTLLADRILLPYRELGLPFLLAELGILRRTGDRAWTVAADVSWAFLEVLADINTKAGRSRPMSPEALDRWLTNRRAAGELAEAFALQFERQRLIGHPLASQIRWVAAEDVGAGFDIHSFDDPRSLILDRFVEIKGHSGERAFHWSQSEIAVARIRRSHYWLYLVDRRCLNEQGYVPEMFSDPYAYFIEDNPAGWRAEPASFRFTAPEPLTAIV